MCAISLQYDQHNPAAICQQPTLGRFTMEELNRQMDQVELDAAQGHLIDAAVAHQRMHEFVQKHATM